MSFLNKEKKYLNNFNFNLWENYKNEFYNTNFSITKFYKLYKNNNLYFNLVEKLEKELNANLKPLYYLMQKYFNGDVFNFLNSDMFKFSNFEKRDKAIFSIYLWRKINGLIYEDEVINELDKYYLISGYQKIRNGYFDYTLHTDVAYENNYQIIFIQIKNYNNANPDKFYNAIRNYKTNKKKKTILITNSEIIKKDNY